MLRDLFLGRRRFEGSQGAVGIAPNVPSEHHERHAFHMAPTCSECGEPVDTRNVRSRPGRGANEQQRLAWRAR